MTSCAELKLIYEQFLTLESQISDFIKTESFSDIISLLDHKEKLTKRLINAHKTADVSKEEAKELKIYEKELREKDRHNLEILEKRFGDVKEELKLAKSKLKINFAYGYQSQKGQGKLVDFSE